MESTTESVDVTKTINDLEPVYRQVRLQTALTCLYVMIINNLRKLESQNFMTEDLYSYSDEQLLDLITEGNKTAFSELVMRHSKKLYRISYRILSNRNDAEDIVQDAYLKLWDNPKIWNKQYKIKFTTWFYKIVINMSLDYRKKNKPETLGEQMETLADNNTSEDIMENKQKKELVEKFISELPERQQTALNLCFYEDISNKEAAEIMDVNLKALESLLMRAKENLKIKISESYEEVV